MLSLRYFSNRLTVFLKADVQYSYMRADTNKQEAVTLQFLKKLFLIINIIKLNRSDFTTSNFPVFIILFYKL